jgi:hypothetical protein
MTTTTKNLAELNTLPLGARFRFLGETLIHKVVECDLGNGAIKVAWQDSGFFVDPVSTVRNEVVEVVS